MKKPAPLEKCFKNEHRNPRIVIIADDLTGALDTAIKFSERGAETLVVNAMTPEGIASYIAGDCDVLSINTSTRHADSGTAYSIVYELARFCISNGVDYLYKKTDSVLRGNIATEIKAMKDASGAGCIPFVPAYPAMKRTLENGVMYVSGKPLACTELADDPFQRIGSSRAGDIFSNMGLDVSMPMPSSHVPSPEDGDVIVYDGKTGDDLLQTAEILLDAGIRTFAGCAGLADAIASLFFPCSPVLTDVEGSSMLVLCGSVNKVSKDQLDYLVQAGYPRIRLDETELLTPDFISSDRGRNLVDVICSEMKTGNALVLDTLASANMIRNQDRACAQSVADMLGRIAFECLEKVDFPIFVIGGDTLLSFLGHFGRFELEPVCEIRKGVVLSYLKHEGRCIELMSKSGGFGTADLISDLLGDRKTRKKERAI